MNKNKKFLVAAGGTGGHLFPAIAVVQCLEKIFTNAEFRFVGTENRMEAEIIPKMGYNYTKMPITGYAGLFSLNTWLLPLRILKSINICRKLIRDFKPDAVLCTGAYISYPAGIAAWKEKVPLVLMESNVNPGKTIKILAKKASLIISSFEETKELLKGIVDEKIKCLGNPVRQNLINLPVQKEARLKYQLSPNRDTVLIFGGSLGALTINKATEKVIEYFKEKDVQFIWQTGGAYKSKTKETEKLRIFNFINEMEYAYSAADLVVSRSGATTVAELAVCGKASVLIPLPSASNQEQRYNAEVFSKKGASVILDNTEAESKLYKLIEDILKDRKKINSMEESAKKMAKKDAAEKTAKIILELIDKKS